MNVQRFDGGGLHEAIDDSFLDRVGEERFFFGLLSDLHSRRLQAAQ